MNASLRIVAIFLIFAPIAPIARSATPTAPEAAVLPDGVKAVVQVTAMDLDVVVTKDDKPVTDLRKDELKVLVDGKPVMPDFFARVDAGALHGPDLAAASPDVILETLRDDQGQRYVPRQFLVFFDDQHLLPVDRGRIIEGLRDFITRLAPSDWMAIVSLGTTSRTLVSFTNSKESLLDGLTRLEKMAPMGLSWDSQFRQQVTDIRTSSPRSRPGLARAWAEQVRAREDGSLQELQRAVSALAARSGKRTLIFVSRGFELHPGQTLFAAIGRMINQFDYSVRDAWQKVIDEANRGGVTINALDGRGLVPETDASESAPPFVSAFLDNQTRRETLAGLAEETGGTLVFERNFFPSALDQIYRDSGSYYLVGVTLTSLDPKKATHDVKVTSTRPGIKIRSRRRYAPLSADGAARNRAEMALITPDATGEFPIAVQIGASKKAGISGRRLSAFTIRFPISALTFKDEGGARKAMVDVTLSAVEDNGAKSAVAPSRVPIEIPAASWERAQAEGFAYTGEMKSRTGNFRFVATVRDLPSGRTGIASVSVRIE
jgi:VWFA-related protein